MYFEKSKIKKVRQHIANHAKEIGVFQIDDDYQMYGVAIKNILENQGREYNEGEPLDGKHYDALKGWVEIAVRNYADAVIADARSGRAPQKPIVDPTDHLLTLTDHYFVTAMQRLGCPNMRIFEFDPDIKKAIEESAIKMDSTLHKYDISTRREFTQQRGKNAKELESRLIAHRTAIRDQKNKPQHVGELIAEYQALKERQSRHGAIWRFFHSTENKERNALLANMAKTISDTMGQIFPKDRFKNLDALNPSEIAREFANARIRGNVEVAGRNRLENSEKFFGTLDAESNKELQNNIEINSQLEKMPMGNNKDFVADINGKQEEIVQPINENKAIEKENIIAKDDGGFSLFD